MQVTVTSADGSQVAQISAEPTQQLGSVAPQLQQQVKASPLCWLRAY